MTGLICENCGFDNDTAAKYCQNCGSFLKPQKSFKKFIESLNFGSIAGAGAGAKGTSIAPLVGIDLDNKNSQNKDVMSKKVKKSYSLKDGSWYCPYCGKKNKQTRFLCEECLREKP